MESSASLIKVKSEHTQPLTTAIQSPIEISSGSSSVSCSDSSSSDLDGFSSPDMPGQKRKNFNNGDDSSFLYNKKPKTSDSSPLTVVDAVPVTVVRPDAMPVTVVRPASPPVRVVRPEEDAVGDKSEKRAVPVVRSCKQFWKAGDYEGVRGDDKSSGICAAGIDHVRVHPKFLHSNATSHKWALGALAELLDNSLDEVCNGATYVHVDTMKNQKDRDSEVLIVEDNGGGMNPDKIRQCMSLGYSAKSKMANTIGQYGNGFKTSTMRLGADAIVFSRCRGTDGKSPTQSIGMLSYTFLRGTRKEDIVVPMIDFEQMGQRWDKMIRTSTDDWGRNLEAILQWSPYTSETDLLKQFNFLSDQGTRIVIYNLWEDDQGESELDFKTDNYDIQLRGVNRDSKNIEMAQRYPNSRHFLTYRHSLRSYVSILYLRLPPNFKIILRGKEVEHHDIVNDMMQTEVKTYKPLHTSDGIVATVTLGFVKDAHHHIDVQGFNVYHKNRLIKPFWRVWNAAGSDGRGVLGVLEANFVEPAHDKQGFERTTVLSRLEARLVEFQKRYWSSKCQEIGYAPRRQSMKPDSSDREYSASTKEKPPCRSNQKGNGSITGDLKAKEGTNDERRSLVEEDIEDSDCDKASTAEHKQHPTSSGRSQTFRYSLAKEANNKTDGQGCAYSKRENSFEQNKENQDLRKRFDETGEADLVAELQREKERSQELELQLKQAQDKIKELDKEQVALIDIFQEERGRRDETEESLRQRLRVASDTISELLEKVKHLEASRRSRR